MVGAQLRYAERVIDEGSGSPLLFLHHFGGSGRTWWQVIERLVHRHRCVAPDLPGFADASDLPTSYTTAATADWVIAIIRELGVLNYRIIGHSMGGKIALAIAARRPLGLRELILLAPSPPTPEPISVSDRTHLLASWGNRDALEAVIEKITVRPLRRSEKEQLLSDMLATSKAAWRAWLTEGSREDISGSVHRILVPVTILCGACDDTIPAEVLRRELLARLPSSAMTILPDAGHLLPVETHEEVAATILRSISP